MPPISTPEAKRRTTRVTHAAPIAIRWLDADAKAHIEKTATVSINCHGFRFIFRERLRPNWGIELHLAKNNGDKDAFSIAYLARVRWVRRSRRLDGSYHIGAELASPGNIWAIEEVPEDWAAFSPLAEEDLARFLADVDRILRSANTTSCHWLFGVDHEASRHEVKRRFYQLARRFHPDHHMDRPDLTPRLLKVMDILTTAYKTLSDDAVKKENTVLSVREAPADAPDSAALAEQYLEEAQACLAEENYAGTILWLHRAVAVEPDRSDYRTMLGRCLAAIPEYRREATEQFEMAIRLDPQNLDAHLFYGELLELIKHRGHARIHYLRVLELDPNHSEARARLSRLDSAGLRRHFPLPSLLERITGRRAR
jgi:hypothetical protein